MSSERKHSDVYTQDRSTLPTFITIGAMKCGTSALHRLLGLHPEVDVSTPKELCFFFDPLSVDNGQNASGDMWSPGNWQRGVGWYMRHFSSRAPARGESSPGYTSPSNPEVAERMAALIPDVKLIYLVRDPVDRAVSQYEHHRRQGTETRPITSALFDNNAQYIARSRYHERLLPFLHHFFPEQIAVVSQEELATEPRATLSSIFGFLGVDRRFWSKNVETNAYRSDRVRNCLGSKTRARLADLLRSDAARLRRLVGRDFPRWSL